MADPVTADGMIDPQIFEDLQNCIDEDAQVREQIKSILQTLERQGRYAQSILSRAHSTPTAERKSTPHLYQGPERRNDYR
jgi:hypothetical protein